MTEKQNAKPAPAADAEVDIEAGEALGGQEPAPAADAEVDIEAGEALGGQELAPVAVTSNPLRKFITSGPGYDVSILDDAITKGNRVDLQPKRDLLVSLVKSLTDDKRRTRIASVKEGFEKSRVIDTAALDEAVTDASDDADTLKTRNKIRQAIKSLPEK